MSSQAETDVLVVGAGSAGAAAAGFFAARGRRVAIVDKRPRGETGARWVNAVPAWCFDAAGVARPRGEETPLGDEPHTFHLFGPARRGHVKLEDVPMAHVDMRRLVQRLLDGAAEAGATVHRGHVEGIERDGERVRAISFIDGATRFTLRARLVIDATGLGAAVRRLVPALAEACADVEASDRCAAAQYHHEIADRAAFRAFMERHGAKPGDDIAFSGVAGGYSTLALFTRSDASAISVLTGSIPALGVPSGAALHKRFVAGAPWIGRVLFGGAGAIPLRRPYTLLGAHGVALVGDAACQVYASHGSGVGMGLLGARALADAAEGTDDPGSDEVLARYTSSFHAAHGGLLAASEAFRRFSQGLRATEVDDILASGLLAPAIASAGLVQRPTRPDARFLLGAPARALRAPEAAARFLPFAVRSVLLDRLGSFNGARPGAMLDRWIGKLVGHASPAPEEGGWSLPDPST
ncbi:Digeranylgeranylglycerophospholipid reductase [Minicystis rosea]|nr:Digeranylgeranylglycerophospholipid reductase [Minicystis rosea]